MQIGPAESRSFELPPQHLTLEAVLAPSGVPGLLKLELFQDFYVRVALTSWGTLLRSPPGTATGTVMLTYSSS